MKSIIFDIEHDFGGKVIETTTAANGYPQHLRHCITTDTISELLEMKDKLSEHFHCTIMEIHRRDGWALWSRTHAGYVDKNTYLKAGESDWYIDLDVRKVRESKNQIREFLFGDDSEVPAKEQREAANFFFDEVKHAANPCRIFYDPNNDQIEYIIKTDENGYSYDGNHYCIALFIEKK